MQKTFSISVFLTIILILGIGKSFYGQDNHYNHFHQNKSYHNPAASSLGETDYKISALYRNQWTWLTKGFRSQAVVGEFGFLPDQKHLNRLGTSIFISQNQAGLAQLKNFEARLGVAYHLPVSKTDIFSSGLAGAFVQRSIHYENLKWDAQYNGAGYDPALSTREELSTNATSHIDFSLGLMWSHRSGKKEWNFGYASHHYRQNQSLLADSKSPLQVRHTLLGSYSIPLQNIILFVDGKVNRQAGAMEIELGGRAVYRLGGDSRYTNFRTSSSAIAGVYLRHNDAVIPMVGFEYQKMLSLYLSYELIISNLNQYGSSSGALELTLSYRGNFSTSRKTLEK